MRLIDDARAGESAKSWRCRQNGCLLPRLWHMDIQIPPQIALNGAAEMTLAIGDTYNELGATVASANNVGVVDAGPYANHGVGQVTAEASVMINGSVDTDHPGQYTLTYTATDVNGNTATATRTVYIHPSRSQGIAQSASDS